MNENNNPLSGLELDMDAANAAFAALDRAQSLEQRLAMALDLAKALFEGIHYIVPALMWFDARGEGITPVQMTLVVNKIMDRLEELMDEVEAKYPDHEGPI